MPPASKSHPLNVVLVEPEIPPNTGNVARLCAATGCRLHLVRPLGFFIDDRRLKRAGLDYWDLLDIEYHDSLQKMLKNLQGQRLFFTSTRGKLPHTGVSYRAGDYIIFGPETRGLPKELLADNPERTVRIPMLPDEKARSLNLSNSVAIVVYEALRQLEFPDLV